MADSSHHDVDNAANDTDFASLEDLIILLHLSSVSILSLFYCNAYFLALQSIMLEADTV